MPDTLKFTRSYDEVGNIRTFVFETGGLSWQPGQYQTYTLPQVSDNDDENSRFFTLASAPAEGEIHISTRVTDSTFKQALNNLQPGDTINIKGLEGDFIWDNDEPVVLVAAGIGVTPFRSMLRERYLTGKPIPATLVYFTRDENIPFKAEFDEIAAAHSELAIHYIVGQSVTTATIMQYVSPDDSPVVYISGPEAMIDTIGIELREHNVTLKQDWFPGYDATSF